MMMTMSFYVDTLTVTVGVTDAAFVDHAEPSTAVERSLPVEEFEPAAVMDRVAAVLFSQVGIRDGYRVEMSLVTVEQGASRQYAVIKVVILASALAALPKQIAESVIAGLVVEAVVRAVTGDD